MRLQAIAAALAATLLAASCAQPAATTNATSPATVETTAVVSEITPATTASTTSSSTTPPSTSTTTTTQPATTPPPTQAPQPDGLLALDVLATIPIANEHPDGYDRKLFDIWIDADGDGCNTRAEVLIRDSLTPAQVDRAGSRCAVVAGDWYSVYDGVTWTDPAEVDIDHVVAIKEFWDSGAWAWTPERRRAAANDLDDPRSLRAVTDTVNQSKGAADPSNWLPPDPTFVCQYLADWVSIKARWQLNMDQSEHGRIRNVLTDQCPGQTIEPWPATPDPVLAPTPPTTVPAATGEIPAGACDPAYPDVCIPPAPPDLNCRDITFRRFTVLPPDPHNFDGDGNGIGCES